MVRFSDMLGGSGEPDDVAAANSPYAALANDEDDPASDADLEAEADVASDSDAVNEPVPMSTFETPEAVLNRLTQYASSARAAEHAALVEPAKPVEPAPPVRDSHSDTDVDTDTDTETDADIAAAFEPKADPLPPVGDDFLPSVRRIVRRAGRGWKRHP
jgi:hypothetical protein